MESGKNRSTIIAVTGICIVMLILVISTIWMGQKARQDSEEAVRSVSQLYLDELAERREQVVEDNLQKRIRDINTALELMTQNDLKDMDHLQDYQARMKRLFALEKFAFVDTNGLIYTSKGTQTDIDLYEFDYLTLNKPEISIKNLKNPDKTVIIAVPTDHIFFEGEDLVVCFMEISMSEMLRGVSMHSQKSDATFSNLYTNDGVALSDTILGGLAVEDNLLDALSRADFQKGYSYDGVLKDFKGLKAGEVSFTYNGILETLSYVPVEGTNWMLTYLIRESVISKQISSISEGTIRRSILQSVLTILLLVAIFTYVILQLRRNASLQLEKQTADAEIRGKEEELERRIALQQKLEEQSKTLAEALEAAETANRAKTAFLSNMSHEIRTPMNAIIGLDNIALNDPQTPEKTRGYLQKIGASAEHLLNLINDILDMSRIESGRLTLKSEEFSFRKLLEAINTMFSEQCSDKGLEYHCRITGEVDDYYIGDDMKLRQVLINILGNAVKFTPEGGKIDLEVERINAFEDKSTLRFSVSDTGIGMSEEFLPKIFDTFAQEDSSSTSKYGSSGLGMAICKNIVEMMNGAIKVESEKGVGSTFTVTVTLRNSDRKESAESEQEIRLQDMSVLIIDDDSVACEHGRLVLEKAGIAAEIAGSGSEAIEMVRLRQTRRNPYDLILIDWKMPEMDGVETTRRIREIIGDESAIIILTAYRWDDVLEEAMEAGVDSFLAKPLFAAAVIEEFRAALLNKGGKLRKTDKKADLNGKRILLAEDMQVNAEIIMMVLETRGMTTDLAVNGKIAVEKFAEQPEGYYSAILMDMRMPEMDGLEATRRIRAMDRKDAKDIPIIALTANAFDDDVRKSLQAGLNAHLTKPLQQDVLFETLENMIRE